MKNKPKSQREIKEYLKVTDSQLLLIKALAKGLTLKETSSALNLNYYNLQKRTQLLYKKFNVHNRGTLIANALKHKIITHSDIKENFRKKYTNNFYLTTSCKAEYENEELTEKELTYLHYAMQGMTKSMIIIAMGLLNMNYCNYILAQICYKMNAKNITQAVAQAIRSGIVK